MAQAQRLWVIRAVEGKGQGMFATRDINKGDLILIEKPAAMVNKWSHELTPNDVQLALAHLTPRQRRGYSTLSDKGGTSHNKNVRIFQTNCIGQQGTLKGYICLTLSRINHSCIPNATKAERDGYKSFTLTAVNKIKRDEEITINYLEYAQYYTAAQRDALYQHIWKFTCTCPACKPTAFGHLSDLRRCLLFGLQMILKAEGRDSIRMINYHIAIQGSNGKDLCSVPQWIPPSYTDADRVFAWFLVVELLEAEQQYTLELAEAYRRAGECLQQVMEEAGKAGKRLAHIEAYFRNIKKWKKAVLTTFKLLERPENSLVYMPDGDKPWTMLSQNAIAEIRATTGITYAAQAKMYDKTGKVFVANFKPEGIPALEKQHNPGQVFCDEYMRKYGHLYR